MDRMGPEAYLTETILYLFKNPLHDDRKPEISFDRLLQGLDEILLARKADAGSHPVPNSVPGTLFKPVPDPFRQFPRGMGDNISYVGLAPIGRMIPKRYLKKLPPFTAAIPIIDAYGRQTINRKVIREVLSRAFSM
jgi:hypothetical protein